MDFEIRAVVHYFFLNGIPAASAAAKLKATYGEQSMSRTGVLYWYKEFREGRESVLQAAKPGRPLKNENIDVIETILKEYPFASARFISYEVNLSLNTVIRILKEELHLKKRYRRWVPKILNSDQKKKRMDMSKNMYNFLSKLKENQRYAVITCDESWFFLSYDFDSKWCASDEDPPVSGKRLMNEEKIMIFSAFSVSGIVLLKALPTKSTFNSTYLCEHILPDLTENAIKSMEKKTKHSPILHYDNAKPHTAKQTIQKIDSLGWKKLEHPPYSPDISPNDFFLYGYVKSQLPYYHPKSSYELLEAITEICSKIKESIWVKVYNSWLERLKSVYESNGEYCYIY